MPKQLEAAAFFVRDSTPQGRFHVQVTAAAVMGPNPESVMFRMVPDIDLLGDMLASQSADWIVLTFRGIGAMQGSQDPSLPKSTGNAPSWMDLSDQTDEFGPGFRWAWVNLVATPSDHGV